MKMLKKMAAILLVLMLLASAACAEDAVRIAALKGPTAMGLVNVMNSCDQGEKLAGASAEFTIAAAADEITPQLIQGNLDVACVPANLASVLYNKTEGGVCVLAVNTLGVIYIIENGETVQSVADLKGRTIYASGKGSTPEYALAYILRSNGIDPDRDVTIEWKSEHAECLSALLADEDGIAMLPQPFVTTAMTKAPSIRVALDLTAEWDAIQAGSETPSCLITGVMIARTAYVQENPEVVAALLDAYAASVADVNADCAAAAQLIEGYGIVAAAVAEKAIPACHIVMVEGTEMASMLSGYLAVLAEANPASVGGKVPGADFYYAR